MAIHTEVRAGSYIRGVADVRVRDDSELVIRMADSDLVYTVPYDMNKSGLVEDGMYRITLASDGSQLFGIVPLSGQFIVRYDGMVAQEGQLPTPKEVKGGERKRKDGKGKWMAPDYLAFTVLLRVLSVNNKRMTIPFQLNYSFEQYKDTNETNIPLGNASLDRTDNFLRTAGMDYSTDVIPWSSNVLPAVDKLLRERNVKFSIIMKNGYVDQVFPVPPVVADDD